MNQYVIELLVRKIKTGEVNPKTNSPFKLDDIKIQEYKEAVQLIFDLQ